MDLNDRPDGPNGHIQNILSKATEYTFFPSALGTLFMIDHVRQQISLNSFKKFDVILSIFFGHSSMKVGINYNKKVGKFTSVWILQHDSEEQMGERNQRRNKYLETMKKETTYQNLWDATKVVLRET